MSAGSPSFNATVVDARGDPINDQVFLGYLQYPNEFQGENLRELYYTGHEVSLGAAAQQLQDELLQEFTPIQDNADKFISFPTSGQQTVTVREPTEFQIDKEVVVYAAVPDEQGTIWFGSRYIPNPDFYADRGEAVEVPLRRAHIGRWGLDSGTTVDAWRTVRDPDGTDQLVCAEVRTHRPSTRGVLTLTMDESVPVGYDQLQDLTRALDPNGKWDVWANVITGLEYSNFIANVDGGADDTFTGVAEELFGDDTAFEEWVFPVAPKFIDAQFRTMFSYQQTPYADIPILTDEIDLGLGALGLFASGFTAGVLTVLGAYFTVLEMAAEFFDVGEVDLEEITGREQVLNQFDKTTHDPVYGHWNTTQNPSNNIERTVDTPTWLYTHRVPIDAEAAGDTEHESSVRGLWDYPDATPEGIGREFTFRTTTSPLDVGVGQI